MQLSIVQNLVGKRSKYTTKASEGQVRRSATAKGNGFSVKTMAWASRQNFRAHFREFPAVHTASNLGTGIGLAICKKISSPEGDHGRSAGEGRSLFLAREQSRKKKSMMPTYFW